MTVREFVEYLRAHQTTAELAATLYIVLRRDGGLAAHESP